MIQMKYVAVASDECGEQLFIFPENVAHADFAEALSVIKHRDPRKVWSENWERIYREPVAAGFTDGQKCYGRSESLGLKSRPEDTALLQMGGMRASVKD